MLAFHRDIPLTERDRSAPLMAAIQERLPSLDVPVLLVWGMRDPVFQPPFLEQWRALYPRAETVELTRCSHFVVEDDPAGVTGAIERFRR